MSDSMKGLLTKANRWIAVGWASLVSVPTFFGLVPTSPHTIESPFWEFLFGHPNGLATRAIGISLVAALVIMLPALIGSAVDRWTGMRLSNEQYDWGDAGGSRVKLILLASSLGLVFSAFGVAEAAGALESISSVRLALFGAPVLAAAGLLTRDVVRSAMDWRKASRQSAEVFRLLKDQDVQNEDRAELRAAGASTAAPSSWLDWLTGRRATPFLLENPRDLESPEPITAGVRASVGFSGPGTVLTLELGDAVPEDIVLGAEPRFRFGEDVEVGSGRFDREVLVKGGRADLAALLTKDCALKLRRAIRENDFQIKGGVIRARIAYTEEEGDAEDRVQELIELAGLLCLRPEHRLDAYARAVREQKWSLPLANAALRGMIVNFLDRPETQALVSEILAEGLGRAPGRAELIVLAASVAAGDPLPALLEVVRESWTPEDSSVRALELAAAQMPSKAALEVLLVGLRRGEMTEDEPSQRAALRLLSEKMTPEELHPILIRQVCAFRSIPSDESRASWADALRRSGGPDLEEEIRSYLTSGYQGKELGVVAPVLFLETLALVGEARSLHFLAQWREQRPDLEPLYDKAVTYAIAAIRKRSGDVNLGSLTVVEESRSQGGLSQATNEGALSEAEAERPARSSSVQSARRPKERS